MIRILLLLILNTSILVVVNCGGPLLMLKWGWHFSWLKTGAWPIIFFPLLIHCFKRCRSEGTTLTNHLHMTPPIFLAAGIIGILAGAYRYVSDAVSASIIASQLVFLWIFALLSVRWKVTPWSRNEVVVLTFGVAAIGLISANDLAGGDSKLAFKMIFMRVGAAALYLLVLPTIELTFQRMMKAFMNYGLLLEVQLVICFFATLFSNLSMIMDHFKVFPRQTKTCEGENMYNYLFLICNGLIWQLFFLLDGIPGFMCAIYDPYYSW